MDTSKKTHQTLKSIGVIQTPYINKVPRQPNPQDKGEFVLILNKKYLQALSNLDSFKYIYVLFYLNKANKEYSNLVIPPISKGKQVGLFASRSPNRPNHIGLSVVKLLKIKKNKIYISSIDAFNGTPILDIKPYIKDLDNKEDANYGWLDSH